MDMAKTADIYVLKHPVTHEIRYVGKADNANSRLKTHLRDSKKPNTPVRCWVKSLLDKGMTPEIEVLFTVPHAEWGEHEIYAIRAMRKDGVRLLNIADGGDQPSQTSEQRSANWRAMNVKIDSTRHGRRVLEIKRTLARGLKEMLKDGNLSGYHRVCTKLRLAAEKCPFYFSCYTNIGLDKQCQQSQ